MKRNLKLVRGLLLKVEALTDRYGAQYVVHAGDNEIAVEDFTPDQVSYHMDLTADAGFLQCSPGANHWMVSGLTWQGHEFPDAVRDDGTWKNTKAGAATAGSWSFGLIGSLTTDEPEPVVEAI
jgi:hypothetical protein